MEPPYFGRCTAEKSYVTVVLRLLLNEQRQLERGEIVDADGRLEERFTSLQDLLTAMERLVARHGGPESAKRS